MINKLMTTIKFKIFNKIIFDYSEDFGDEIIFVFNLKKKSRNIILKAKNLDSEDYSDSYFRWYILYNKDEKTFYAGAIEYITNYDGIKELKQLNKSEIDILKVSIPVKELEYYNLLK